MTLDQWLLIFKKDQEQFPIPKFLPHDLCSIVTRLHEQKDRLLEAVVAEQRHNISKAIQQNELFLENNDFFKDTDSRLGSLRNSGAI